MAAHAGAHGEWGQSGSAGPGRGQRPTIAILARAKTPSHGSPMPARMAGVGPRAGYAGRGGGSATAGSPEVIAALRSSEGNYLGQVRTARPESATKLPLANRAAV
jgi:hypothetical protein